LHTSNN